MAHIQGRCVRGYLLNKGFMYLLLLTGFSGQLQADPFKNQTYQNQTKIRQLEIA